ncbi:hypothetical protein N9T00_00520 [bacterium]|nr:hypothetical protein [bacterium]
MAELDKSKDYGLATSILAGVGSGVFKIFEGAATLGATLLDLGIDKNRAEAVEEYFDKINPFDEAAEATAAGKITELIINIGIPGGLAFKIGSGLTKATLKAKEAGTYLSRNEKLKRYGKGAGAGGVAEGVFVGDVEDAGTFGDFLGGPTEIDRESDTPQAELANRLKFGLEGGLFTVGIGAGARGISKLRNQTGSGKAITDDVSRWIDKWISRPLRARGPATQEGFEAEKAYQGLLGRDTNIAENSMIKIDTITNRILKNFKRSGNKVDADKRKNLLKKMNDILTDGNNLNPAIDDTGKVTLRSIDSDKVIDFSNDLINNYKADPKDVAELVQNFNDMRGTWSELFTLMGSRLTPAALEDFQKVIPKQINNILDKGYEVFKNNPMSVADNYGPSSKVINVAVKEFIDEAANKGVTLSEDIAKNMVNEVWINARLPKGVMMNENTKSGVVRLGAVPNFFLKSEADNLLSKKGDFVKVSGGKNLSDLTGVGEQVIKRLLGKAENPMSTIVEGTNALSIQVRLNQYLDDLVKQSNVLKKNWDEWDSGGRVGPEPRVPFLVDNAGEAKKYFGSKAIENRDFEIIAPSAGGSIRKTKLGRFEDIDAKIKPVDDIEAARLEEQGIIDEITSPIAGKYALSDYAQALKATDDLGKRKDLPATLYQNLVLYPKATSQMAKTILAPFTHARNFISAAAFAAANGFVPFGNTKDVKKAFDALQLKGFRKDNEFYQELLELGVVNSQVQVRQVMDLMEDVKFGEVLNKVGADYNGFNTFMKGLKKTQKFAQDAYTAEDDFWKIFTYLGEQSRLRDAYKAKGLQLGDDIVEVITDSNGKKFDRKIGVFNDEYLKKQSAKLVKNNIPNYAFVSEFIKGLRKLPVGNFVAFPAEIMRTGTNIVSTALDEIFFTARINGKEVNPLRARGLQRLTGMTATTAALPLGTVAMFQTLNDVSDEELDAMRRYVPEWSKNSVLVPFKDKEDKLSYVDFSHLNAYDTLTRPLQTVVNAVTSGREDKDGIMDDFILGLIESTKELGQPFISESIWTEALQDVAPILGRGGVDASGREIYNKDPAIDPIGSKIMKSVAHLVEAQAPLNWRQLGRLGLAIRPIDSLGKYDDRGNEYELGNELLGIAGLRRVKVDPRKSLNYKITNFKDGIRDARNLFTKETLKGGVVTPEQVVDAYINSNRALYDINRRMFLDIDAAKVLGMGEDDIAQNMINRGERTNFSFLNEGLFRPYTPSRDVAELFDIRAAEIGAPNAFEQAADVIDRIREVLSETPLGGDLFPDIQNPFSNLPEPTLGPAASLPGLPSLPNASLVNNTQFGNINPVSGLTLAEETYLSPLEQNYRKKTRTT